MRWIKIIWTAFVVGGAMVWTLIPLGALRDTADTFTAMAQGFGAAAAAHYVSGLVIIVLARSYKPTFPPVWHDLRPAERDGRIYQRLGVPAYRRWLLASPVQSTAQPLRIAGKASLAEWDTFMRGAEFGHLMLFGISLPIIGWLAYEHAWSSAFWMGLINVPWNIYPVLLQRSNRARMMRFAERYGLPIHPETDAVRSRRALH